MMFILFTDNATYNVIMQGCFRCRKVDEMVTFMKKMTGRGFSFDATTAELLVKATSENPSILDMIPELHAETKMRIVLLLGLFGCVTTLLQFRLIPADEMTSDAIVEDEKWQSKCCLGFQAGLWRNLSELDLGKGEVDSSVHTVCVTKHSLFGF